MEEKMYEPSVGTKLSSVKWGSIFLLPIKKNIFRQIHVHAIVNHVKFHQKMLLVLFVLIIRHKVKAAWGEEGRLIHYLTLTGTWGQRGVRLRPFFRFAICCFLKLFSEN